MSLGSEAVVGEAIHLESQPEVVESPSQPLFARCILRIAVYTVCPNFAIFMFTC